MRSENSIHKLVCVLFLAMILSAGLIGVSYAVFSNTNEIVSNVSMGNIDVIFSNLCIAQDGTTDPSCVTQADITDNGKSIKVNICGANPGCTATINYEITNNGTVPVIYQLEQPYSGADSPVRIEVCESSDCISGNGGKAQGKIIITTDGDIEPGCSYNLSTGLNFQQAAVESG